METEFILVTTSKDGSKLIYTMPYLKSDKPSVASLYLPQAGIYFVANVASDYALGKISFDKLSLLYEKYIRTAPFLQGARLKEPNMAGLIEGSYIFASCRKCQVVINFILQIRQECGPIRVYSGVFVICRKKVYLLQSPTDAKSINYKTTLEDPSIITKVLSCPRDMIEKGCQVCNPTICHCISIYKVFDIVGQVRLRVKAIEQNNLTIQDGRKIIRQLLKQLSPFATDECISVYPSLDSSVGFCGSKSYNKLVIYVAMIRTCQGLLRLAFSIKPVFLDSKMFILLEYNMSSCETIAYVDFLTTRRKDCS